MADIVQASSPAPVAATGLFDVNAPEQGFGRAWQIAQGLSQSGLVPDTFRGKPWDVMVALDIAQRTKAAPMMVMQNLYMVHGKPGFSASYLIACFNACGRFTPLAYEFEGKEGTDEWGCRATAKRLGSDDVLNGALVTLGMAKKEGWTAKNGSKWLTMPEQMLRYRAATFFIRSVAPEIAIGFPTQDELEDSLNPRGMVVVPEAQDAADLLPPAKTQDAIPMPEAAPAPEVQPVERKSRRRAAEARQEPAPAEKMPADAETRLAKFMADNNCNRTVQDLKDFFNRIGQQWDAQIALDNVNQILADMVKEEQAMAGL